MVTSETMSPHSTSQRIKKIEKGKTEIGRETVSEIETVRETEIVAGIEIGKWSY